MNSKRVFVVVFMLTVLLSTSAYLLVPTSSKGEVGAVKPVEITALGGRSITLTFTLKNYREREIEVDGKPYLAVDFPTAVYDHTPGEPQIPYHSAVLGIPVGARVSYSVIETIEEVQSGVQLIALPEMRKVDGWPEGVYRFDERIYASAESFPAEMVQIDPPAFLRDQQIVRLRVPGVRVVSARNLLIKYKKVVVQVTFSGGRTDVTLAGRSGSTTEEALYRNTILNYDQAKNWRKVRATPPASQSFNSIQQSQIFYTFPVSEEGIYRIDGDFLQSQGIDLNSIDPNKIRLFNNGGTELPRPLSAPRPDSLVENAILVQDGGDGRFDANDFILFFARGLEGWNYDANRQAFEHYINHYDFANVYWLSVDGAVAGKRMQTVQSGTLSGNAIETYQGLAFIEEELATPLQSGLDWFGRQFATDAVSRTQNYTLDLPNALPGASAELASKFVSLNSGVHSFSMSLNENFIATQQFTGFALSQNTYLVMRANTNRFSPVPGIVPGTNTLQINYSHTTAFGQAYLDWVELLYQAQLTAIDNELIFTVEPASGLTTYRVSGFAQTPVQLFDVTDFANVRQITGFSEGSGSIAFSDTQSPVRPKRYAALTADRYRTLQALERVEMRDIKRAVTGAEFIIISHAAFLPEAQRLQSFRENGNPRNQLSTVVVDVQDIFNNFSAGLVDPVAIRNFLQYTFEHWSPRPSYVLLLGDGDYDPKNIISSGDQNWIPTLQSDDTLAELGSRAMDSWYTYISGNDKVMDMAIGRINAQTVADARNVIDKIVAYETQPLYGVWRNTITLVGDDELITGGRPSSIDDVHIIQTEELVTGGHIPRSFDFKKIYLPEFPKVISASVGGVVKPEAREALIRQMNEGTLIVNFVGHGNSQQWAHEVVFQQSDNDRVQNQDKLIFFVAATCDWALFDNPGRQSQAEDLLLMEGRGAIGMLSSTRLVFSAPNAAFNRKYYDELFSSPGQTARVGDAFVATRAGSNNINNDEKFHIYGDPTLRLARPASEAVITSLEPDSILALSTMQVSGEIRNNGVLQSDFNGTAFVNTFDSEEFVRNVPERGRTQLYHLPGNSIYRGTVPVVNGRFTARFIVPKDISYGGNRARVSAYFWNNETDGVGYVDDILVSSTSSTLVDKEGPAIRLFFRGHENFTTGDIVGEQVTLVAELADTVSGINIAGEIGHRITLTIDPDEQTCLSELNQFQGINNIDLTDLFQFNEGDFLRGRIEFPLTFPKEVDLGGKMVSCLSPDGEQRHNLVLKAWDNANNSSTASVEVMVEHEDGLVLREVMNYPNPMSDNTTFTFIANQDVDIRIKIYTIAGQLIRTLEYPFGRNGFNMIEWDGRDADGDVPSNGVYLYKLIAKGQGTNGIEQREIVGRLAIVR